ncbi:unnamed protein product [Schistosoma curassoni]|uniref:DH domain-containing protein n=1 Tax=Schistosoma curassoni TaxID=6186 RepID=A0A183KWS7_9TREM|nr:unnamed protein product [Schistosoma curassoni]
MNRNKLPLKALLVQPVQRIPRYELLIKVFTSSKSSPSSAIRLVHAVLYRRILLFRLRMLRPTAAEAAATWSSSPVFVVACTIEGPDHLRSLDRPAAP